MVKIDYQRDPTLDALDHILEAEQAVYVSKNIGFGVIGEPCARKIWYNINATEGERFTADTLRIFRNGHSDEAIMAADLRKIPGIELHTHDPNRGGKQYKMDDLNGRFTGRLDGVIKGIIQAPVTYCVWEHKSVKDSKFQELLDIKLKFGEKQSLSEWNTIYYAQAQCNMKYSELSRHYMTVSAPGIRKITSIRTEFNKDYADALTMKAKRIIDATIPPERMGKKESQMCKWCHHRDKCHG